MYTALLAQADDTANGVAAAGLGVGFLIFTLVFMVAILAYLVFYLMSIAKATTAAGYPALNGILIAFVPIYNYMWLYKLYTRVGENGWKCLLQIVPIYNIMALNQLAAKLKMAPAASVGFAPSI